MADWCHEFDFRSTAGQFVRNSPAGYGMWEKGSDGGWKSSYVTGSGGQSVYIKRTGLNSSTITHVAFDVEWSTTSGSNCYAALNSTAIVFIRGVPEISRTFEWSGAVNNVTSITLNPSGGRGNTIELTRLLVRGTGVDAFCSACVEEAEYQHNLDTAFADLKTALQNNPTAAEIDSVIGRSIELMPRDVWVLICVFTISTMIGTPLKAQEQTPEATDAPVVISVANAAQIHQLRVLQANTPWANDLEFSPDGTRLAVAETGAAYHAFEGVQGKVRIWGTTTWEEEMVLSSDGLSAMTIDFYPDGRYLAVGYTTGEIQLWYVNLQQVDITLKKHNTWVKVKSRNSCKSGGMSYAGIAWA
jgi:WD40 repeat protein